MVVRGSGAGPIGTRIIKPPELIILRSKQGCFKYKLLQYLEAIPGIMQTNGGWVGGSCVA